MGTLDDLRAEVTKMNREVNSMVKKLNGRFSSLWVNVQTAHSNGVERLLSSPAGKSLDARAKTIGQGLDHLKSASATAISSSVSGMVEDLKTFRGNVDRNVQALRSGGGGEGMNRSQQPTSPLAVAELRRNVDRNMQELRSGNGGEGMNNSQQPTFSALSPSADVAALASPMISFPASTRDMLAGVASPRENPIGPQSIQEPSSSSAPSTSSISFSDEVSEEDPHPDMSSVSATSVFSIGYVGPPLLGPQEPGSFVLDANDASYANDARGAPSVETDTAQDVSGLAPVLKLEDVRKSIGNALVVYKKIRALGFRESSWENKMPWHNPRPASLASGLKWPRQKFSSVRERHEYHRRARRRGRYLIGPTPGWSWFAADVVFLYFLINNPAGNFLI